MVSCLAIMICAAFLFMSNFGSIPKEMPDKINGETKQNQKIKIITDKPKTSEYTFIDDRLSLTSNHRDESEKRHEKNDISYSIKRYSDKLKRDSTNYMRFKTNKITKPNLSKTILLFMNNSDSRSSDERCNGVIIVAYNAYNRESANKI
jgi:hypothetical protein